MKKKKIISPISCEKEPLKTVYNNIAEFARIKEIPFALAVRKYLIVGNAAMERNFKLRIEK